MAENIINQPKDKPLFSFEFVSLCIVLLSSLCSLSVFYSFYHHLDVIGIPVAWRRFLCCRRLYRRGVHPHDVFWNKGGK